MQTQTSGKVELNAEFLHALEKLENSSDSLFITGKAGTGKSTLLSYFREHTRKKIAVVAPTGVAALNVAGETIHSFFRFKTDVTWNKIKRLKRKSDAALYKNLEVLVIDEISMVRADLLDCIDRFLELNGPRKGQRFGGVQLVLIGDLYQLPPVVTQRESSIFSSVYESPYFFSARSMQNYRLEIIELEKIYRQKDADFIRVLNAIRNRTVTTSDLAFLNRNVGKPLKNKGGYAVHLTTKNESARKINQERLAALKTQVHVLPSVLNGQFDSKVYPTEEHLELAVGAQVMLLNNDPAGRWVNGSLGVVEAIDTESDDPQVAVRLENGEIEIVPPFTWEIFHYSYNTESKHIETEPVGSFRQFPLRLSWAVTIHKSQGKTFDWVAIDLKGAFATGQAYVALSRARSLEGISLVHPVELSQVRTDWRIAHYLTQQHYAKSENTLSLEEKMRFIQQAIATQTNLEIVYLKPSDERSRRVVRPISVGEFAFKGCSFLALEAFCQTKQEKRTFRLDRILKMQPLSHFS